MAGEVPEGQGLYPYLYLDTTYHPKVRWDANVTSMALLACVGVDEEGLGEVSAVEVVGSEKSAAYASLLRGLLDRGPRGVKLVVSDDHEGIKSAVLGELAGRDGEGAWCISSATCSPTCRRARWARTSTSRRSSR